jgi:pre-60S factor REI1
MATEPLDEEQETMEEEPPEINPTQSLFDNRISPSLTANLHHMNQTYSFHLPDPEYLIDLEGLLGYCSEKVRLGHTCLYCQRIFSTCEGCMKHMRDKRHCKILYERGVDMEEFDVFYDFEEANAEFFGKKVKQDEDGEGEDGMDEEEDGEWEDVDEDEDMDEEEDDDLYAAYQEEIATHGFDITPLGELIFPDGRIIGHRGLARYYKQRFAPDRMERSAVRAARVAAGDRIYGGRVVNLYRLQGEREQQNNGEGATGALVSSMGRMSGSIPTGRNGKGILVSAGSTSAGGSFTTLSLYRYRAAVKKQRREDDKGRRLQNRTQQHMNKMNKKGNILQTGFSTSHAPR